MAMGIVSSDDFDLEKSKLIHNVDNNESKIPDIRIVNRGRGQGNVEVPNGLRKIIGETSVIDGRNDAIDLAKQFGIGPSSVSAYNNGSHSTDSYNKKDDEIVSHVNTVKERISKKARSKLILALNSLTPEKLVNSKAGEIASVAKDMSVIVKNMEPEKSESKDGPDRPQFIFYAPTFKQENSYDTIYSKE